jgi:hypothetical protein
VFLNQMKDDLVNAPGLKCEDVLLREAQSLGPEDDYEQWRGGPKFDFSAFSPNISYILGTSYPIPALNPTRP